MIRAPGAEEDWPGIDDRIVMPGSRFEVMDGQLFECAPAKEPHALAHTQAGFVLRSHARASFSVATDMLTRANRFSDIAPDVSVFPEARDPVTGERQLEHLSFEICDSQARSDVARKARLLVRRGVRRVFCIDVHVGVVLEWNAAQDEWIEIPASGQITDRTCFVRAVPVRALLEEAVAENASAAALLSKKNPVLQKALEEERDGGREQGREQGRDEGREQGRDEGREQGLRVAIESVCEMCGVAIDEARRAQLESAGLVELRTLLDTIKRTRAWSLVLSLYVLASAERVHRGAR